MKQKIQYIIFKTLVYCAGVFMACSVVHAEGQKEAGLPAPDLRQLVVVTDPSMPRLRLVAGRKLTGFIANVMKSNSADTVNASTAGKVDLHGIHFEYEGRCYAFFNEYIIAVNTQKCWRDKSGGLTVLYKLLSYDLSHKKDFSFSALVSRRLDEFENLVASDKSLDLSLIGSADRKAIGLSSR